MNKHTDPSLAAATAEPFVSDLLRRRTHTSLPETHAAISAFATEPVAAGRSESGLQVLRLLSRTSDPHQTGSYLRDETRALVDTMDKSVAGQLLSRDDMPRLRAADTLIRRWQDENARRPANAPDMAAELKQLAIAVGRVVSIVGHEEMTIGTRYR